MNFKLLAVLGISSAMLVGCGGGGDEVGPIESIQLSQDSLRVTGPAGACASGGPAATVRVFGGFPPYKIYNSIPGAVLIDTAVVNDSGEGFNVTFLGGCLDNMPVTVTDEAGSIATLSLFNSPG